MIEEKKIVWSYNNFYRTPTFVSHCIYFNIGAVCAFLNRDGTKPRPNKFVLGIEVIVEGILKDLILRLEYDSFEEAENVANEIARKMNLL